jgi:FkbM family methyltransferase
MNINEITDVLEVAYKKYNILQNPLEIQDFAEFYQALNCKNVLEIGTYLGGTFYLLCKLSNLNGKKISIDCPYATFGSDEVKVKQNEIDQYLLKFSDNVFVIRDNSNSPTCLEKLKNILNGELLDFIFIDGDHTYDGVKSDFEIYKNFLKNEGYIAFHDISSHISQDNVKNGVCMFWNELKNKYTYVEFNRESFGGIGLVKVAKYKENLNMDVSYEQSSFKLYITNRDFSNLDLIVSVRDRDTKIPIYFCNLNFSQSCNEFYIIPQINYDFSNDINFSGFLIEFYDKNKNFIDSKDLKIKDRTTDIPLVTRNYYAFDCLFINYKQFFYDKIYDPFIDDTIETVIDIGANVGLFSNYISWKKNVKLIHALEPVSKPFNELKKQFYYYNSVKCHKIGIHYNNGKSLIKVDDNQSILNTFIGGLRDSNSVEEVDVCTLQHFMDIHELKTVDLIKMDVEALEYEILNSMNDSQISRCKNWLIEYHANDDGKCEILQNRFSKLGYLVTNVPDQIPNNIGIQGFFFAKKI